MTVQETGEEDLLLDSYSSEARKCGRIQQRHIIIWTLFLGFAIAYSERINLSVAIVAMVNQTYVQEHDETTFPNETCPNLERINSSSDSADGEFKWTHEMQGLISGSFFYGYGLSQLISGILSDRFGAKHILGFGIFFSSVMSLIVPPAARLSVSLFIVVRIVAGFFQGAMYPALTTLLSVWSPVDERGFLFMIPNFGINVGVVLAFPITGWLCDRGFAGGWPSAFYLFGILGCLWLPPWLYVASNSPDTHPRISEEEKTYIHKSLQHAAHTKVVVPWRSILTSVPVMAVVVASFMGAFGHMSLIAFLPTYMNEILKFDIVSNGFLSVVPYIASAVSSFLGGFLSERVSLKLNSVTASRKIFNFLASIVAGIFLILIPVIGCNRVGAIALLTLSTFLSSLNCVGYIINPLDIAPRYSGSIMGFANTFSVIGMIVGPYVTGALTNSAQTLSTWAVAFYVMGSITIFGGTVFMFFGTAKLQPWAVQSPVQGVVVNKDTESEDNSSNVDV